MDIQEQVKAFERYDLDSVTDKNIENYIAHLLETENISDAYQKQMDIST